MKWPKSDKIKFLIKIILSLIVCLAYSVPAAYCCFYLPRVWGDDRALRQFGLILLLILLLAVGFVLHFLICNKLMPFSKKKYKIIYWIVSVIFMNPYVWFGLVWLISYIPGVSL